VSTRSGSQVVLSEGGKVLRHIGPYHPGQSQGPSSDMRKSPSCWQPPATMVPSQPQRKNC